MFKPRPSALIGLLIVVFAVLLVRCNSKPSEPDNSLTYLNHHDSVQYVEMNVCAQCHTDKHKTFIHTGMGSSFGLATKDKTLAEFKGHVVHDSSLGLNYLPFFKEGKLYIKEFELEGSDTIFSRTEAIDYIIGSGQHTNSHLMLRNGYVVQAPLTFYTQDGKWDLPPGFEDGKNSRFSRIIDSECMSCHNSIPVMQKGMKRQFAKIGLGIDCERCHGPGQLHVKYRQENPQSKAGEFDSTIVNPARLSSELLIDLCQRCHLQGNNVLKPGKAFTDFKPGMKLSEVFEVYLPEYEGDNSNFNMADHSARLQSSNCFTLSEQELNCITCHNPHVSVKRTKKEQFNAVCRSCHQTKLCKADEEHRMTEKNSCVNCHMPLSNSKDIPHVRIHDHRIQIPSDSEKKEEAILKGLYSVNNPNPSDEMLIKAYLSYYEKFEANSLYLSKANELLGEDDDKINQRIHLAFLQSEWVKIVKLAFEYPAGEVLDAFTAYRISEGHKQMGNLLKAELYMLRAIELEPDRFEFLDELATIYIKLRRLDRAIATLKKSIKLYPFNPKSYNNLAYCLFLKADYPKASTYYRKALELDHQYIPALENMANLYLTLDQYEKGKEYLNLALKYGGDKNKLLKLIKEIDERYE